MLSPWHPKHFFNGLLAPSMANRPDILVVDDEQNVVESLRDLLRFDYQVHGATGVDEGLEIFRNEPIHVVLSDQRMPGANGVDFLGQCFQEKPQVMRLLMTGYADVRAVIGAINDGMVYRYISKPWDPDELLTVIKQAAAQYELFAERRRLLEELRARNRELESANEVLLRVDEAKTAFINVASHELRTPLTILTGLTDLALRSEPRDSSALSWLERIGQAGGRLQHLVDQLVAMLAAGRTELQQELRPVDLATLLRRAADEVRVFVDQRKQTLTVDAAKDLGTLQVDEPRLCDCLEHLLLNAIKFTPDGGHIALEARRDSGAVVLVVRDSGDGIRPEDLPRLFDAFFTSYDVSRHLSGQFEYGGRGLGLGLSVVKAQVEMQGGQIEADNVPGAGAAFTITLPDSGAPRPPRS
ncbi:MAG: response regulator [bacterium]|nr:response regulator [bacterium]